MCAHIATVTEVAVDLEHHSFHSFLGFVCLMQVRVSVSVRIGVRVSASASLRVSVKG